MNRFRKWLSMQVCWLTGGHEIEIEEVRPVDGFPWVRSFCTRCPYEVIVEMDMKTKWK